MAGHMPTCTHPAAAGHLGIAQNTPAVAGEMSGMGGKMAEGRKDGRGEGVCEASAASGCLREARPSADPKALISGFNFTTWWQLTSLWCPQCIFLFFFFLPHPVVCRILVPQPGIKPMPPAMRAQSLNHWTTREVPSVYFEMISLLLSQTVQMKPPQLVKTFRATFVCWDDGQTNLI